MTEISDNLRKYLYMLMVRTFSNHSDLDRLAIIFMLSPESGTIKSRCEKFVREIHDDKFHKLAEYVFNWNPERYYEEILKDEREGLARALRMYGFSVEFDGVKYTIEPKFGPEILESQKQEARTLLEKFGFVEVQEDLNSAEEHYIKGNYPQSLTMSRKALEDLFSSMSERIEADKSKFLSSIKSKSARSLIKEIYGYACKGHELSIPEYEAIYGYHLIVSTIYFILILFSS